MKKVLLIIAVVLCAVEYSQCLAQNGSSYNYYYADNKIVEWYDDSSSVNIIVAEMSEYNDVVEAFASYFNDEKDIILASDEDDNIIITSPKLLHTSIHSIIDQLSISSSQLSFVTYSKDIKGERIWLRNEIFVLFSDSVDIDTILTDEQRDNYEVISVINERGNEYIIKCRDEWKMMLLANSLQIRRDVEYATPDFYDETKQTTSDQLFGDQWNLRNTGQNGYTQGIDINVVNAWDYITNYFPNASHDIKVAVIDDGVAPHTDFYYGGGVCKVLSGYTANGNGTGHPVANGAHGECCAGIIGAVHNNIGIAGIAPYSKIIPIRIFKNNGSAFSKSKIAEAIRKAWEDFGADVLSNSWSSRVGNSIVSQAVREALNYGRNGKGCVAVFATGNEHSYVGFPACVSGVIAVGAIDTNGYRCNFSNFGPEISVVAPGVCIPTLDREGGYGYNPYIPMDYRPDYNNIDYEKYFNGTSAACPHVSGLAALMLSVNPNLTGSQVKNFIERTARKVRSETYDYQNLPSYDNGRWNKYTGYGLIDAFAAVKAVAEKPYDLYTRDNSLDDGSEPTPYSITPSPFDSPDIWVRRNQDGGTTHQKARQNHTNYVYVNVHNNGNVISSGEDTLKIYFHMAGIGTNQWPNGWRLLGQARIPQVQSNGYTTVCVPGLFPALLNIPPFYSTNDVDYMLLSKIVSDVDDMTFPECNVTGTNVTNNNNISSKNVVVSNTIWIGDKMVDMAIAAIENFREEPLFTNLKCSSPRNESGKPLFKEAEIRIVFDAQLIRLWKANGGTAHNMKRVDEVTFLVTGPDAQLNNFVIPANYEGYMVLQINFLTKEYTEKDKYNYIIDEFDPRSGEHQGSLTVMVDKSMRSYLFDAETGDDLVVAKNSTVTISAENIGEDAIYNWYNAADSLIGSGEDLSITASTTSRYKLEVIATADGYKDYDSIYVVTTSGMINSLSPNPANGQVTMSYELSSDVTSASIVIANAMGQVLYTSPLDVTQTSCIINLQSIPAGQYRVRIESQGTLLDSKSLIVY